MGAVDKNTGSPQQLKDFLAFLRNLWGALAGISVFFPLSNVLIKVIPLDSWDQGALVYLSPQLFTTLASLCAIFVVIFRFEQRAKLHTQQGKQSMLRLVLPSFFGGLLLLVAYLALYFSVENNFYAAAFGWDSGDPRRIAGDLLLLVCYCGFFLLVTRAFVILGMAEYVRRK